MFDNTAAFRTGAPFMPDRSVINIVSAIYQMVLDCLCYSVSAGKHAVVAETGRAVAGDSLKLLHYLSRLNAAAPGE